MYCDFPNFFLMYYIKLCSCISPTPISYRLDDITHYMTVCLCENVWLKRTVNIAIIEACSCVFSLSIKLIITTYHNRSRPRRYKWNLHTKAKCTKSYILDHMLSIFWAHNTELWWSFAVWIRVWIHRMMDLWNSWRNNS